MPEIEFVNRELAESEAARAIGLLNQSDESKVEAWFAMQAVADQVGPASNVGVRGISWAADARTKSGAVYWLSAACLDGRLHTSTGAPSTLEEAALPENLSKAIARLEEGVAKRGGWNSPHKRPQGTGLALVGAVSATPEGLEWVEATSRPDMRLGQMVKVADLYGREGVNPRASLGAHTQLLQFADRAALIRAFPTQMQARAKAMSLREGRPVQMEPRARVSPTQVTKLAIRTGVTRATARALLREALEGKSKTKMMRAVNEVFRAIEKIEARESSKVAA